MRTLYRKIKMFIIDLYYKISTFQANFLNSGRLACDHNYIMDMNRQLVQMFQDLNSNFITLQNRCNTLEMQLERIKASGVVERFEKLKVME